MKNRREEYWNLVQELSQPPRELEDSVDRARKRAKRTGLIRRLATPAASIAAAAACFVLLVNVFPTFALACSSVPGLRELTAAVAFSPSLSAAVEHDYVQYIGKAQTVDGVTVHLEYAIVDKHQAVFFYSVDGGQFWTSPSITASDGKPVGGYATTSSHANGEHRLSSMTLSFTSENTLPDRFTLELYLKAMPAQNQSSAPAAPSTSAGEESSEFMDPRDDPSVLRFTFDIILDPARISEGRTVEVGRWLDLNGQRILVDRLEFFPTRTVLYLGEDDANTAWLKSLKFWFEDEDGTVYDDADGSLSASGNPDSHSYLTYYFQSFYYDPPQSLTLRIHKAEWQNKDAPHVHIDLTTGEADGLPDGVEIGTVTRTGQYAEIEVLSPTVRKSFAQSFESTYWDPTGGEHSWNRWSGGTRHTDGGEEIASYEMYFLDDYPWDTVEFELRYTSLSQYDPAISVPLF